MKLFLSIFLSLLLSTTPSGRGMIDIAEVNKLKKQASEAYKSEDYATSIMCFKTLLEDHKLDDDKIKLNLANAYLLSADKKSAQKLYKDLQNSGDALVRSQAFHQIGVMEFEKSALSKALVAFKQALKSNPGNEAARYNYELVKKMLQENPNQDKSDQEDQNEDQDQDENENQDQNQEQQQSSSDKKDGENEESESQNEQGKGEGSDEQGQQEKSEQGDQEDGKDQSPEQDKKDGESEQGEQDKQQEGEQQPQPSPDDLKKMLQEMEMTEEMAKSILEATRNAEIQYIQQMKRSSGKKKDSSKPDW